MRSLILMRHAKAAQPRGDGDFNRPLAERGRAAAPAAGAFILKLGLVPERLLVSSALRARETCALASAAGGLPPAEFDDELYLATPSALLRKIRRLPARTRSLMIIGHNPGLAELTHQLADEAESDAAALLKSARKFPTASIAVFDVLAPWSELQDGDCALRRFITPADLGGVDED